MILYLVRHGESAYNAEGRIQGQSNVPLSELGRRQSAALAEAFADIPLEAIYCSPLDRARDTARPLAERTRLEPRYDARWMELNAGVFQGLLWPEIDQRFPEAAAQWRSQRPDYRIPGGEWRSDLMQRAEAALVDIHREAHEHVAVVAHGGILSAGLKALLGIPAERNPFMFFNGSISRVEWSDDRLKLLTLNEVEHLRRGGELLSRMGDL